MERRLRAPLARVGMAVAVVLLLGAALAQATAVETLTRERVANLRVPFVANAGQTHPRVAFYAPTFEGTVFVTRRGELVYSLPSSRSGASLHRRLTTSGPGWTLTETLVGGRPRPVGHERSATGVSSFVGDDPSRWRAALSTYEAVGLGEVWPGVTLTLRPRGTGVEKIFTVNPGASVTRIRVDVAGADSLRLDDRGALVAATGLGAATFSAPVAYQERDGVRQPVAVAYRLRGRGYGFRVGVHDPRLPLVIDPLVRATYLGGSVHEFVRSVAVHPVTGDVYVAGCTSSANFPNTTGGAQATFAGGGENGIDAVVARLNSALTMLIQATYLGGSDDDEAVGLAIHPTTGDVYIAGYTASTNFPGVIGSAQPTSGGDGDAFVARLPASLTSLTQATHLGGSGSDVAYGVAIRPTTGDVYIAGATSSTNFPHTAGGAQPTFGGGTFLGDGFVARLSSTLTSVSQATYLGGSSDDVATALAIHPTSGDIYAAGQTSSTGLPSTGGSAQPAHGGGFDDAFVARLPSTLNSITRATYVGGSRGDFATAVAVHPVTGDVYVTGSTNSTNFPQTAGGAQPVRNGPQDAFLARLNAALTSLSQATYLGGSDVDVATALAIHPGTGDLYVAGNTGSTNFPSTEGGAQPTLVGGSDAFVARLPASLTSLTQATYLGGSDGETAQAVAFHPLTGDVYVAGLTTSANFPGTVDGAQSALSGPSDTFVARLTSGLGVADHLGLSAVVNQPTFTLGQTLTAGGAAANPGLPGKAADFYVGIARPDGSIQFFTEAGIVLGNAANVTSFRPLAVGVPLAAPFTVNAPNFHTHPWATSDLRGLYVFFIGAVTTGALAGGTVPTDQILGLATAAFTFP